MATSPMLSPDGQSGDIPIARIKDAIGAGFKPAAAMQAPDGSIGYVPQEKVVDALKAGFLPHQTAPVMPKELAANLTADTRVNAPGPFQQTDKASLPLKIAAGYAGMLSPGSEAIDALHEVLPSTRMAKAGQSFNELEGAIGNHTVPMTEKLSNSLQELKDFTDLTKRTPPPPVVGLVNRITDLEQPPLTYKEARTIYSDISDLSASDKMLANSKMNRLLIPIKQALGETIADTADSAGRLQQYQGAMKGFAKGAGQQEIISNAADAAKKYAVPAAAGAAGVAGAGTLYKLYREIFGP